MKLLNIDSNENKVSAYPDPHALNIKEFKNINEQCDKPERMLAYIYHMYSSESPYAEMSPEAKEQEIKKDLFGDVNRKIPKVVQKGEKKYQTLTTTPEQKLLEKAVKSVYKLMDYLDNFDPIERNADGKLVWSTKDYIRNMEKLGGVVDSLDELRERVKKKDKQKGEVRGDVKINKYNR